MNEAVCSPYEALRNDLERIDVPEAVRRHIKDVLTIRQKMGLNEWAAAIHENAVKHGWWEEERGLPEILMLCVSELSEALEEYRSGKPMLYCENMRHKSCEECMEHRPGCHNRENKPEGIAVEVADCLIRIMDWCGKEGLDIEWIVRMKHDYNKGREYRHGGKVC